MIRIAQKAALSIVFLSLVWACEDPDPKPGKMEPLAPPPGAGVKKAQPAPKPTPQPPAAPVAQPAPIPEPAPVVEPEPEPEPPPPGSVLLRWKLPPSGEQSYLAVYSKQTIRDKRQRKLIRDPLFKLKLKQLFKTKQLPQAALSRLARPVGRKGLDMTVQVSKSYGDRLEAKFFDRVGEIPDEIIAAAGPRVQMLAAQPAARGEISTWGKVHSLLEPEEHNLVALSFGLTEKHVLPGDEWQADVKLIGREDGFDDKDIERLNRVKLKSLKKLKNGEQVALLQILIAERVAGELQDGSEKIKQKYEAYFVGQGKFLVQAGRWQQFSGRLWKKSSGDKKSSEQHRVLSLVYQKQRPKKSAQK